MTRWPILATCLGAALLLTSACSQEPAQEDQSAKGSAISGTEASALPPDCGSPEADVERAVPDRVVADGLADSVEDDAAGSAADEDSEPDVPLEAKPDSLPAWTQLPATCTATSAQSPLCPSGYAAVPIDHAGISSFACAAVGPVWGNRPDKPVGVYSAQTIGGDAVVVDGQTLLMWQSGPVEATSWAKARFLCDDLVYAGYQDWRLPSLHELESLLDHTSTGPDDMIDTSVFPDSPGYGWSLDRFIGYTSLAWFVSLYSGFTDQSDVYTAEFGALCVRNTGLIAAPASRFGISASGLVIVDQWTKLQWQRHATQPDMTWAEAKTHCEQLTVDGLTGWRLPGIRELHGLVDLTRKKPAVDAVAFPDMGEGDWFWSANKKPETVRIVQFGPGRISWTFSTGTLRFRCVRDPSVSEPPVDTGCKPGAPAAGLSATTLPGETTSCQALGIVACDLAWNGSQGNDMYRCFDAAGKTVAWVSKGYALAEIPCSQAQLDAWVAAYPGCWKLVPKKFLPDTPLTQLLDPKQVPPQVCANIDGTEFAFNAGCAEHHLTQKHTTGGGNTHGTWWTLTITPPTTATLQTDKYPFVQCASTACSIDVDSSPQTLEFKFDNLNIPDPWAFDSQAVLDECVASFAATTACDK